MFIYVITDFPVDTRIYRVTKRLGWIPQGAMYQKAHQILGDLISPERYYPLHFNLLRHRCEICVAGVPRCELCPLRDVCEYYRKG